MSVQEQKARLRELLRLPDDLAEMLPLQDQSRLKLARLMEQELPGILLGEEQASSSAPETLPAFSAEDKSTVRTHHRPNPNPQPDQESP